MTSQPTRKVRVLILAETANPEWASVPLIGWSLSHAISRQISAHIVTQIRNRDAFVRAGLAEGDDFTSIDNEWIASPVYFLADILRGGKGKGWTTSTAFSSLTYYSFESEVWRRFESRLANKEFDLVHRVTPVSPTSPSPIAKKLAQYKIPFVIGPLNGGLPWIPAFRDRQMSEHDWLSDIRSAYKFLPAYRSTRQHSAAIICGSRHTLEEMPHWVRNKCIYVPENGVDLSRFPACGEKDEAKLPLRAAFVGRLVPYKGVDLLLIAAADFLRAKELELHVIGDGPEKANLEAIAKELGVASQVVFHGWLDHKDVQSKLNHCDFTVLPSVREFGGGVVIESMALGLPPIVANYGGPAELVDDKVGVQVSFTDKDSLTAGIKAAISTFVRFPQRLRPLGAAGRKFVERELTWDMKAKQILRIYEAVLTGDSNLSNLSMLQ
jgi:glycosyltransferase involved in cell wall biosynthesis